jgi:hypothetical protein
LANIPNFGPDQATCETSIRNHFTGRRTAFVNGEEAERLEYQPDQVQECITAYKALTCDQLKSRATDTPEACNEFALPKVALNNACNDTAECVDSSCEGPSGARTCQPFLGQDANCSDGGTCATGLYCQLGSPSSCKPLRADGTACNANYECATGGCNGKDAGTPGTCGLKGGPGTTCYATSGCSASGASPLAVLGLVALVLLVALTRQAARRAPPSGDA